MLGIEVLLINTSVSSERGAVAETAVAGAILIRKSHGYLCGLDRRETLAAGGLIPDPPKVVANRTGAMVCKDIHKEHTTRRLRNRKRVNAGPVTLGAPD